MTIRISHDKLKNCLNPERIEQVAQQFEGFFKKDFIEQALDEEGVKFRHRDFPPLETTWSFVTQVLQQDRSCRQAVADTIAAREEHDLPTPSANTGAYCQAQKRLPETLIVKMTRHIVEEVDGNQQATRWLWRGFNVKLIDGTVVDMPDTPANRAAFPSETLKSDDTPAGAFPQARIVGIFSLAVGLLLSLSIGPIAGKNSSENVMVNQLLKDCHSGDLLVFDRYFTGYFNLALMLAGGLAFVSRQHASRCYNPKANRKANFAIVKRFNKRDRLIKIEKPWRRHGTWWTDDADVYDGAPDALILREIELTVTRPGFRTQNIVILTSLLDSKAYPANEVAEVYRRRWAVEVDLKSMKKDLNMARLRSKTPSMVTKEIWVYTLAYNLIRTLIRQAACLLDINPIELSFKAAVQFFLAFRKFLYHLRDKAKRLVCFEKILAAIGSYKVGNRPDRAEPRAVRQRKRKYPTLTEARAVARNKPEHYERIHGHPERRRLKAQDTMPQILKAYSGLGGARA